ncbi:MAG: hypothetical protein DLM72_11165 [Candidatus Nitrosopolaris wilkensis]|nr:MAG: hypothetical protein DLM72_11165 [Candidatus Nitrosopolaris wilkensis]
MPLLKKSYHCKVKQDITSIKVVAPEQEYYNLQHYLQTKEDPRLCSTNKLQEDRYFNSEYLISVDNDLIRIEHNPKTIVECWVRIQVKLAKCRFWISVVKAYEPKPKNAKICQIVQEGRWMIFRRSGRERYS